MKENLFILSRMIKFLIAEGNTIAVAHAGVGAGELRLDGKVADDRSSVVRLSDGHWDGHALVLVFGLLNSHLWSDVSVLGGLVTHFREERSSQTESKGGGISHDSEENQSL